MSKGKEVLTKYLNEQLKEFKNLSERKRGLFPFLFIILDFQMDKNNFETVEKTIKEYFKYINFSKLRKYKIHAFVPEELKKIFLEYSMEQLKELAWFDGAFGNK